MYAIRSYYAVVALLPIEKDLDFAAGALHPVEGGDARLLEEVGGIITDPYPLGGGAPEGSFQCLNHIVQPRRPDGSGHRRQQGGEQQCPQHSFHDSYNFV